MIAAQARKSADEVARELDSARGRKEFAAGVDEVWQHAADGRIRLLAVEENYRATVRDDGTTWSRPRAVTSTRGTTSSTRSSNAAWRRAPMSGSSPTGAWVTRKASPGCCVIDLSGRQSDRRNERSELSSERCATRE